MATVRSLALRGKTVNVPHTEDREALPEAQEKASTTFDENGLAEVSDVKAEALVRLYPSQVELVESDEAEPAEDEESEPEAESADEEE